MKADSKKIQALLESDISQYKISKETGIAQSKISYLRLGLADEDNKKAIKIKNLSLNLASKLTDYAENNIKKVD